MSAPSEGALAIKPVVAPPPVLQIAFSDEQGGLLSFNSKEEICDWLKAEIQLWAWLRNVQSLADAHLTSHIEPLKSSLQNLDQILGRARDNPENLDIVGTRNYLEAWKNTRIIHSGSRKAQVIFKIKELFGVHAACAALAHTMRAPLSLHFPDSFMGVLQYHLLSNGVTMESNSVLLDTFERTQRDAAKGIEKLNTQASALIATAQDTRKKTVKSFDTLKRWHQRKWGIFIKARKNETDAEIEKMHQIQKLYTEHMNMKAPVEYWEGKGQEHLNKADTKRNILLGYIVLAVIALGVGINAGWDHLIGAGDKSIYAAFTILLLATTILFWIARILVRLYLSELHLGMDANERAVMAKTYLALINDNKIEKTDRNFVLSALFRPTTDGIIKDDGAPTISPASFASNKLTGL